MSDFKNYWSSVIAPKIRKQYWEQISKLAGYPVATLASWIYYAKIKTGIGGKYIQINKI